MLTPEQVRAFIEGHSVHGFDPFTRALSATVTYGRDGRCLLRFADGRQDQGDYGFAGDSYWTRYDQFREGKTHAFRLEELSPGVMQAWFTIGARAFVQSHSATPAPWPIPQD